MRGAPARWSLVALVALVLALAAGCQVDVALDVDVAADGSGTVTAGVGLDAAALARAGQLDQQLRTDDLAASGWSVAPPVQEGATTWVRATKAFAHPDQAAAVIAEVAGPDGPFRGFAVSVDEALTGTTWAVTGSLDPAGGLAAFSDQDLAAVLGGDPFGGTLDAIEAAEGRPVGEMVDVAVQVSLPGGGQPQVVAASFTDAAPTSVDVRASQRNLLAWWWLVPALAVGVLAALVALRRRAVVRRQRARARHLA